MKQSMMFSKAADVRAEKFLCPVCPTTNTHRKSRATGREPGERACKAHFVVTYPDGVTPTCTLVWSTKATRTTG